MSDPSARLAAKHERLVARAAAQRTALAERLARWRGPLSLADRGMAALRVVGRHPSWLLAAVLVIVVWRPRTLRKWPGFVWSAWRIGRRWFRT
jgi:hypothetical protein